MSAKAEKQWEYQLTEANREISHQMKVLLVAVVAVETINLTVQGCHADNSVLWV